MPIAIRNIVNFYTSIIQKALSHEDSAFFEFEVESLMFDVDIFKFKAIALNTLSILLNSG
ncbi:hypothetical protein I3300191I4_08810 [Megasphaera elsdenii]